MKNKFNSFDSFLKKAFPLKNPFLRDEYGIIHNSIKWLSIRIAYVLFRLGVSANSLDIIGLLLMCPAYLLLYYGLINNELEILCLSYFIILCLLSIDFMDGMLSRHSNFKYEVGVELDNLCPDVIKFFSFILIGYLSGSPLLMIISIFNCSLLYNFINKSSDSFPKKHKFLLALIYEKYSINSFRIFVVIFIPVICIIHIFTIDIANVISQTLIISSTILSLIWIYISLNSGKNNE
tara:strand:- start:1309 stop:2016 length:708 start_codon:yes stop_codon:yes gene_type:complete